MKADASLAPLIAYFLLSLWESGKRESKPSLLRRVHFSRWLSWARTKMPLCVCACTCSPSRGPLSLTWPTSDAHETLSSYFPDDSDRASQPTTRPHPPKLFVPNGQPAHPSPARFLAGSQTPIRPTCNCRGQESSSLSGTSSFDKASGEEQASFTLSFVLGLGLKYTKRFSPKIHSFILCYLDFLIPQIQTKNLFV